MIEQFQHKLTTSFFMWFDNFLLTKGEAYTNTTGEFFYYDDPRVDSDYNVFGSPYKQWVTDSSITDANVPSGVFIGGNFSGRDDGVVLDFDNGLDILHSYIEEDKAGNLDYFSFDVENQETPTLERNILRHWKTDVDLGPVTEWGSDKVIVLDSASVYG